MNLLGFLLLQPASIHFKKKLYDGQFLRIYCNEYPDSIPVWDIVYIIGCYCETILSTFLMPCRCCLYLEYYLGNTNSKCFFLFFSVMAKFDVTANLNTSSSVNQKNIKFHCHFFKMYNRFTWKLHSIFLGMHTLKKGMILLYEMRWDGMKQDEMGWDETRQD